MRRERSEHPGRRCGGQRAGGVGRVACGCRRPGRRARGRRARARPLRRAHLHEGVLGAVRPGEVLVALEIVAVPDLARVAHGEALAAELLLHHALTRRQVAVDRLAHARLDDVAPGPVSVSTRRPSFEEKKRIVMPLEPAWAETRIAASQSLTKISSGPPRESVASRPSGIARDVELVGRVGHQLQAREERGVVDGGGHLGDPAAHRVLEPAGRDLGRQHEPAVERARPQGVVEREGPARRDDRPVQDRGGALDVGDARLAAVVGGGELGHELGDAQRARLGRGPLRAAHLEARAHGGGPRVRDDVGRDGLHVEAAADARGHQAHAAAGHAEGGVARRLLARREGGRDVLVQHVRVQGHAQARGGGLEAQGRAQHLGLDRHSPALEGHLHRGGHDAQGEVARLLGGRLGRPAGRAAPPTPG